jgi:hypothetical protein
MTLSRRKALALIGGGVILAAGTAGGLTLTRTPQTAGLPWQTAGEYAAPRMRALSYAILAPNPHNRQPWMVDLGMPDQVALYVDTDRMLPHTDPFNRQITIGLSCFLEVLRMAALEDGLDVTFDLFPDGADAAALDARPVAVCHFAPTDAARDPLFAQVLNRRSLKEPFDEARLVPDTALPTLIAAAENGTRVAASNDPETIAEMRALSHNALRIEIETPRTYQESVDLFRIGAREVDANPDGIAFTGPLFEGLAAAGLFTRQTALDTSSTANQQGLAVVFANTDTAMGHIWQVTQTNTRRDQINTGRDWVRINLAATALGLGLQPLSQALQEYPEIEAHYDEIHQRLAPEGGTVQMWARLGYGPEIAPSPRWPVDAKLLEI